ncbi:glycosyltransferase [Schnuerera sp. xch1]|uniref:glycosyltransferase n=1 Tax=Schnuerera sp. xch1 TaxID=2874283 RepID=UPI001CBA8E79|nr:glycosyltransferase [Schnuerera sp. xch1]MBZ2174078.1 glycosyltransferase [Schnuerera sp. xch1]
MYILVVARGYPTEKYKMNGIFEFDQAKALVEAGHKVIYAAIDVRSIRRWRKWGIEKKKIEGVEIYAINIPLGRIPKSIRQKISILGLKILYRKILKEQGKPDIMHAHFAGVGYTASKLKQKTNIPFVMTEHLSSMMKPTIDNRLFHIASRAYENTDALITVSHGLKDIIKKRFNKDAIYIPNIVDTKLFTYSPNKENECFNFISIGGLIERKRMDLTIEAFASAFKNNEKVTLTIFGDGPERKKLEELIRRHNIDNKVKLMGLQSRKIISEYLKKSNYFVLASQAETFGVVYIEALASGIPVIATKCGGPESFVNENNGLMIDVNDKKQLTEAMKHMYNNMDKYDRKSIAIETKEKFSTETIADKIIDVYEKILNTRD